jgi:prepilin-type N-terminal cleavage/methylation domain-containing protein
LRGGGFTLIEVLIVVAVIAVITSIAVPTYVARRLTANEGAAISTVRSFSKAQFQFRSQNMLDVDRDGISEFATPGELAGVDPVRGTTERLSLNLLSFPLGTLDGFGAVTRHGYRFATYLPDSSGVGVIATRANAGRFDPVLGRDYFTCVAWPVTYGNTGKRTFFVNQQGQIMTTTVPTYTGVNGPPAGAALAGTPSPDRIDSPRLAITGIAADGHSWMTTH